MDISKINKNAKISGKTLSGNFKKISISSNNGEKYKNSKKINISPNYDKSNTRKCGGCSRRRSGT